MRFLSYLSFLLLAGSVQVSQAANIWEAGELTYPNNETEISAFINTEGNTQLQAVLCTKDSTNSYRFTLLLPEKLDSDSVIKVIIKTDDNEVEAYAEVSGNSMDIQIDESLMLSIPDSTKMTLSFDKDDADYLKIPAAIEVNMHGADMTIRNVASECTALCLGNGFKCNYPLLSSLLWPRDQYRNVQIDDIDDLCTTAVMPGYFKFTPTKSCKLALDRFYKKEGVGPLSYVYKIFKDKNSIFQQYVKNWNEAVALCPYSALDLPVTASDKEWYLILYSLVGKNHIREFPSSYYSVKKYTDDPTTLIYDIDNRYEMELLKYSSVLYRRVKGSVSAVNAVEKALKTWQDFYRQLVSALPSIHQAQAVRPVVYREMMLRVWNLAGKPTGLKILPENMFRQGTNGRPVTTEPLETQCSFFEGSGGDQFFFASEDCIKGFNDYMRTSPLNSKLYQNVVDSWNKFASNWAASQFYTDGIDDAVGEHPQANLALTIMSLFKLYGFGDYFLLRECISSRDADICGYEQHKAYSTYTKEFNNRLDSITNASDKDGSKLNALNELWLDYYHNLEEYLKDLVQRNIIPLWRAEFAKAIACVVQTNAILNFPYDREEFPQLSDDEEFEGTDSAGKRFTLEQNKLTTPDVIEPDQDEDVIDDDIIIPE